MAPVLHLSHFESLLHALHHHALWENIILAANFILGVLFGGRVTTPTAKPPNLIPHQNFRLYGIMCHLKNQLQAQHKIDFFW